MSRSGHEIKDSESQSKFIQDRITATEKHFGQLCETFSSYTRKTARLRDKGDQISKDLISYVDGETLNPSAKQHFSDFAHDLSTIQDYRNAQVTRLESKVQQPLSNYGLKCKHTKADLKAAFAARDKETKIRKKLDVARTKGDTRHIATLETDLQRASVDASRTTKNLEQQSDKFELEKLQDAKKIMTDFVMIEMAFHAKALEVYSQCYKTLNEISVDTDIREFRTKMRPSSSSARMTMARSGSVSSVNSSTVHENTPRADLRGSPHRQQSPQRQQQPRSTANGVGNMMEDDDDESEEGTDEEEETDEEESEEEETEAETERSHRVQTIQPASRR
ncbi:CBY1-interacting BAR domain-containing protein 1-A-like isoform X2 [Ruditapes philippinarum]|uniref:CBY1-interacting BAR domain-containing protein 1-A-like isoform X2 n=1 Tax=Ruditapes philippinarum TaxID=129788 RepID=UPI00295BD5BB|nr:CBY1-interacting BAR domain-containing protein 1-A-like isoform X2 [Ruditapes philippinarum]